MPRVTVVVKVNVCVVCVCGGLSVDSASGTAYLINSLLYTVLDDKNSINQSSSVS